MLLVLLIGIVAAFVVGLTYANTDALSMLGFMGEGVDSMGNLIVVTLLASGMLGLIQHNGGISFLIDRMSRGIKGKRGAQAMISLLVAVVNMCTANNTIAIITVGGLARQISDANTRLPQDLFPDHWLPNSNCVPNNPVRKDLPARQQRRSPLS